MKFLKILNVDICYSSRDKKEIDILKDLGADVTIYTGECSKPTEANDICQSIVVFEKKFKNIKNSFLRKFHTLFYYYNFILNIRRYCADVISCHDINCLFMGFLSNLFKKNKSKLVYDAHEFEIGRNGVNSKLKIFFKKNLENFLIKKSVFTIVVNDSIADEMMKIYKLKERPLVIRNIPYYWSLDYDKILKTRSFLQEKFGCDSRVFIVMYHGGVSDNRGIEFVIKAISKIDYARFVILGNADDSYKRTLINVCNEYECEDKVLFLDAVPEEELYQFIGASDVGMINIVGNYKSYYYALPNKLFQNIQSLTPVICSDFPEMNRIVNKYNIGLLVDPKNVDAIAQAIKKMHDDRNLYNSFLKNLKIAKKELCFENEKYDLISKYKNLFFNK